MKICHFLFMLLLCLSYGAAGSSLHTYQVRNASAEWLADRVSALLSDDCRITYDDRTDTIIFFSSPSDSEMILRALEKLDSPSLRKQVSIETLITETTLDGSRDMGIAWEARQELRPGYDRNIDTTARVSLPSSMTPGGTVNIGTLSNDSFTALISAISKNADVNVISSPHVMAQSGEEARILVGSRIPYSETSTAEGIVNRNVRFLETGIRLAVTPVVEGEWVNMRIRPEVSVFAGWSPSDNQPIINTREADTRVSVKSSSTVVIGGLIKEDIQSSISKIPGLGDIPFLGSAFRRRRSDRVKTEMTVFMTPHIIDENDIPAGARLEQGRIDAIRTSVRETRRKMEVQP